MGKIDSLDLFGLAEMELFAIYLKHAKSYKNARDIGANLGLHSILMAKLGWNVIAYEPDPEIYGYMRDNIDVNNVLVGSSCAAVSNHEGEVRFTRVLENRTGSHITGAKKPYGDTDEFTVQAVDAKAVLADVDFAKIDVEGHEAVILKTCTKKQMDRLSMLVEVGNRNNAELIFGHFAELHVPIWAQRLLWQRVKTVNDMPISHKEGNVFIGHERP